MKTIDEMGFYTKKRGDGKIVAYVREFPDLRSKPQTKAMDAISEIVELTGERIREIHESQAQAAQ